MKEPLTVDQIFENIYPQDMSFVDSSPDDYFQTLEDHLDTIGDIIEGMSQQVEGASTKASLQEAKNNFHDRLWVVAEKLLDDTSFPVVEAALQVAAIAYVKSGNLAKANIFIDKFDEIIEEARTECARQISSRATDLDVVQDEPDAGNLFADFQFAVAKAAFRAAARVPTEYAAFPLFSQHAVQRLAEAVEYDVIEKRYCEFIIQSEYFCLLRDEFPSAVAIIPELHSQVRGMVASTYPQLVEQGAYIPAWNLIFCAFRLAVEMTVNFCDNSLIEKCTVPDLMHYSKMLTLLNPRKAAEVLEYFIEGYRLNNEEVADDGNTNTGVGRLLEVLEALKKEGHSLAVSLRPDQHEVAVPREAPNGDAARNRMPGWENSGELTRQLARPN